MTTAEGTAPINLRLGDPGLPTPEPAIAAAIDAMHSGLTRYTPTAGLPELRARVAEKFRAQGIDCAPEQTIVGCGAKSLLFALLLGDELAGREVVIPAPHYAAYPRLVTLAGGTTRIVPTRHEDGLKLTPAGLRAALRAETRWIFLNSPNNPTGTVYSAAELRALAAELSDRPDVLVLSDEIYEQFRFGSPPLSTAALDADLAARTVTLDGVSKTYSMTGWRIGYATGPAALIEKATAAQLATVTCAPSVSQAAALAALSMPQEPIRARNSAFVELRDIAVDILRQSPELDILVPDGAFYLFPRIRPDIPEATVVAALADTAGVLVGGGTAFGSPGHFRMTFAVDRPTLVEACTRIVSTLARLVQEEATA